MGVCIALCELLDRHFGEHLLLFRLLLLLICVPARLLEGLLKVWEIAELRRHDGLGVVDFSTVPIAVAPVALPLCPSVDVASVAVISVVRLCPRVGDDRLGLPLARVAELLLQPLGDLRPDPERGLQEVDDERARVEREAALALEQRLQPLLDGAGPGDRGGPLVPEMEGGFL